MKKIQLILLGLLLTTFTVKAQISTTNAKVSDKDVIIKTVKIYDCTMKVLSGSILKTETVKKGQGKTYTITNQRTLANDEDIAIEKEIKIKMKGFGGKASLFTKDDKPGKIFVDYWLNPENEIPNGKKLNVIKRSLKCPEDVKNVKASDYTETKTQRVTTKFETHYLEKVKLKDYDVWKKNSDAKDVPDWFKHTDLVIEVLNNDDEVEYALVDKYDRDVIYELEVKNRAVFSTVARTWEASPLTIPLKLRFGYTDNNIRVQQQFLADANIGAFLGYNLTRLSSRKEQGRLINLKDSSLRGGPFMSLSSVALDKTNTTSGNTPLIDDQTDSMAVLSYGLGLVFDIKGFNIGAFYGWETGFGPQAKNWNFNNRGFLGLGLGFNLNNFKK